MKKSIISIATAIAAAIFTLVGCDKETVPVNPGQDAVGILPQPDQTTAVPHSAYHLFKHSGSQRLRAKSPCAVLNLDCGGI